MNILSINNLLNLSLYLISASILIFVSAVIYRYSNWYSQIIVLKNIRSAKKILHLIGRFCVALFSLALILFSIGYYLNKYYLFDFFSPFLFIIGLSIFFGNFSYKSNIILDKSDLTKIDDQKNSLKPKNFRVGSIDNAGYKVSDILILAEDFVIYVDNCGTIVTDMEEESPKYKSYIANLNKVSVEYSSIQGLEPQRVKKKSIYALISRGLIAALRGKIDIAIKIFEIVEKRLSNYRVFVGRTEYLIGSSIAVIFIFSLFLFENLYFFMPETWLPYLQVFLGGAIGGQLSVAIRARYISIDLEASRFANIVGGFGRVIIAMLSSLVTYFAFQLDIIFANFSSDNSIPAILLISIIAGFSEQLVPSLIQKLTDSQTNDSQIKKLTGEVKDLISKYETKTEDKIEEHDRQ